MAKVKRQMIIIDEDKCNGCGLCIPACPEGALQIINDKVVLVKESYCDGLGACLGDCPEDALSIEERLVGEYDEQKVIETLKEKSPEFVDRHFEHMKKHKMKKMAVSGVIIRNWSMMITKAYPTIVCFVIQSQPLTVQSRLCYCSQPIQQTKTI